METEDITKLGLQDNDIVIVKTHGILSLEESDRLRETIQNVLDSIGKKNVKVMILEEMDIEILGRTEAILCEKLDYFVELLEDIKKGLEKTRR